MAPELPDEYGARRERRPDVSFGDIERAAIELLKSGKRPTVEGIKGACGGSPHTILRALPRLWSRLGQILDDDPTAGPGVPREVVDLATQLWDRAREWAIRATQQDEERAQTELTRLRHELELRQHAVSQRERDLERQLLEIQQAGRALNERLSGAMRLYEQERGRNTSLERRIARLEADLSAERTAVREIFASVQSRARPGRMQRQRRKLRRKRTLRGRKPTALPKSVRTRKRP